MTIPDRKNAQVALGESNERYRKLLKTLPAGVVQMNVNGSVFASNAAADSIISLKTSNGQPNTLQDSDEIVLLADGSPSDSADCPLSRCLATGEPQPAQLLGIEPNGHNPLWIEIVTVPIRERGKQTGALINFSDEKIRVATEQAQKNALALSEKILKALSEQSLDGLFRTDTAGKCIYTNAQCAKTLGMTAVEATGDGWLNTVPPEDREQLGRLCHDTVRAEEAWFHESQRLGRQGQFLWSSSSALLIKNESGTLTGYVGINRDITLQKNTENPRSLLSKELNHRVKSSPATMLGFMRATARFTSDIKSFVSILSERLLAMARLHDALAERSWQELSLKDVVSRSLGLNIVSGPRITVSGTAVTLHARLAMPLTQAYTNYSPMRCATVLAQTIQGIVFTFWKLEPNRMLTIYWQESHGPVVKLTPANGWASLLSKASSSMKLVDSCN